MKIERPMRRGRAGRVGSMDDALSLIPDQSRVYSAGASAVPMALLQAMADQHDRWTAIELVSDYLPVPLPVFAHPGAPFHMTSLQPSAALAEMVAANAYTSAASALSSWATMMSSTGALSIDVALIHVSTPGPDGRFSLGVNTVTPLDAMVAADVVIAQINPRMPYTYGAAEVHRDEIDVFVEVEHPIVEFAAVRVDETTRAIGAFVAEQIVDGSWLQLGLGALPDALCSELANHRKLGVHSGMIADGVIDLHAAGALTGDDHPDFPGKIVTGGIFGTSRLFEWAHQNRDIVMTTPTVTHGLDAMAALPNFCAINSAIEVALDGSINSERIGERAISGPGGAPDYGAIAHATESARFFVALPSTAARGTKSRIVPELQGPPTVPGDHVDIVVTEFGVADIAGLEGAARAEALWAVAHPDFAPDSFETSKR